MEKAIVIGDHHIPYHDKFANELVLNFIKEFKPEHIDLLGDLIDFWQISKFRKDPARKDDIQSDIDIAQEYLSNLRQIAPQSKITLHFGNHLCRLRKFIWSKTPELNCIRSLDLRWLLACDKLDIKTIEEEEGYDLRGKLALAHGTIVSQESGDTAKRNLRKYGLSVISAHTHRLGSHFKTDLRGIVGAWENGCLCDLELIKKWGRELANWQQGFSIVFFKDHKFSVQQILITKGTFIFGEKEYAL